MTGKALMTHYVEGSIVSRELHDMMHQYAADARFDAELSGFEDDERDRWKSKMAGSRGQVLIHKGNNSDDDL